MEFRGPSEYFSHTMPSPKAAITHRKYIHIIRSFLIFVHAPPANITSGDHARAL
jgi:hypothetical protein